MRAALFTVVFVFSALGESRGRLAELSAKGIAELEQGRYLSALNALEEVWEQDQSDAVVAENLAMAYLYAERDLAKALPLAEKAINLRGKASFLVQHPHEKVGFLSGDMADFCTGRLSISATELVFTAREQEHSFVVPAGQLREVKSNRVYGSVRGMYEFRTSGDRKYTLRPRNWSNQEHQLVLLLARKYIRQE